MPITTTHEAPTAPTVVAADPPAPSPWFTTTHQYVDEGDPHATRTGRRWGTALSIAAGASIILAAACLPVPWASAPEQMSLTQLNAGCTAPIPTPTTLNTSARQLVDSGHVLVWYSTEADSDTLSTLRSIATASDTLSLSPIPAHTRTASRPFVLTTNRYQQACTTPTRDVLSALVATP